MLSSCGLKCITDCKSYRKECYGCNEMQGRVSWAKRFGSERCAIYNCVHEKKLTSCGECSQMPCRLWFEVRNPFISDKDFSLMLKTKLDNLMRSE